jgi:hypothetical protein
MLDRGGYVLGVDKYYDYTWVCQSCGSEHTSEPEYCQACRFDEFTRVRHEYTMAEWCTHKGHDMCYTERNYPEFYPQSGENRDKRCRPLPGGTVTCTDKQPIHRSRHDTVGPNAPNFNFFYAGDFGQICNRCVHVERVDDTFCSQLTPAEVGQKHRCTVRLGHPYFGTP